MNKIIVLCLFKTFVYREFTLSVIDSISIDGDTLCNLITDKSLFYDAKVHFVAVMDDFLCGYNTTQYQLDFLKHVDYPLNVEERKIVTMASEIKLKISKDLFVFRNHQLIALHFIANKNKLINAMQIISQINDTSLLKIFGIDNCRITNDEIKYILNHEIGIEKLYLNNICSSTDALITTLQLLHNASKLKTLIIKEYYITDEMMNYVLPILHNNQIEDLGIGNNNLETSVQQN